MGSPRLNHHRVPLFGGRYGCFDKVTHEWTDGVLPTLYRQYCANKVLITLPAPHLHALTALANRWFSLH